MIRAVLAMNRQDARTAVDLIAKAETFDRANLESRYTRASALLMAGRAGEAAKEFQAVLNLRNSGPTDPTVAFSQLGLYAAGNEKEKSRTAYRDFVALWDNADRDVPVLRQARKEYGKLQ
jgi:eukaryotic-like serine/threonine-protein kinase